MALSEDECSEALQEAAEELGKSPTKHEYEELGIRPSSGSIKRIIGSWNLAKERAGLETYSRSTGGGQPVQPKPDWVELPQGYGWEELTPQQRWYYKNREHRIAVKSRRLKALKGWFADLKAGKYECSECSESHPSCLVFHHVEDKSLEISFMVNQGFSRESILQEIDKCVALCANCHHKEHIDEVPGGWDLGISIREISENPENLMEQFPSKDELSKFQYRSSLRTWVHYYKGTVGCTRCSEHDPACLEFHHKNPKNKTRRMAVLVCFNPCKAELLSEIDRCEVICRNCHRKEHLA